MNIATRRELTRKNHKNLVWSVGESIWITKVVHEEIYHSSQKEIGLVTSRFDHLEKWLII